MANTHVEVYNAAMALFTANATVTPDQLVKTLGPVSMAMAPASKHAWALKKLGFDIQANKNGREVVSYTMLTAPAAAPVGKPVKAAKPVKAPKPQKVAKTPSKAPKPTTPVAVAAAKSSPTKARPVAAVKFGPADKTGRSDMGRLQSDAGFNQNELENLSELEGEAEDMNAVLASLRA